jgi:hypothetical protein
MGERGVCMTKMSGMDVSGIECPREVYALSVT